MHALKSCGLSPPAQDQVLQRCFAAEPVLALAASPDGAHLAGGGASGALYLWETASGRLLRSWPAHYQVLSCIFYGGAPRSWVALLLA